MIASSWSFGVIIMTGSSGTRRRGDSSRPGLIVGEGTRSVRPEERAAIGATLPAQLRDRRITRFVSRCRPMVTISGDGSEIGPLWHPQGHPSDPRSAIRHLCTSTNHPPLSLRGEPGGRAVTTTGNARGTGGELEVNPGREARGNDRGRPKAPFAPRGPGRHHQKASLGPPSVNPRGRMPRPSRKGVSLHPWRRVGRSFPGRAGLAGLYHSYQPGISARDIPGAGNDPPRVHAHGP